MHAPLLSVRSEKHRPLRPFSACSGHRRSRLLFTPHFVRTSAIQHPGRPLEEQFGSDDILSAQEERNDHSQRAGRAHAR